MGDELTRMRERLATRVIAANHIGSDLVADALWTVPRHLFLPDLPPEVAYRDDAIVTKRDADGLAISRSYGACAAQPSAPSAQTTVTSGYPAPARCERAMSARSLSMSTLTTRPEGPTICLIRAAL